MELVCIQDFGDRKVGDIVLVPDGADFSGMYFAEKPKEEEPKEEEPRKEEAPKEEKAVKPAPKARKRPANASDEAQGTDTGNDKKDEE